MKNIHIATYQDKAKPLAEALPNYKHSVIIRLGGKKPVDGYDIQINSVEAIVNSIDKANQKSLLLNAECKTLPMLKDREVVYPCVVKGRVRSCGTHVVVVNNKKELEDAKIKMEGCNGHIIEPLFSATGEYRLHCTQAEVFFSVKKVKRNPEDIIINHKNHYNIKEFPKPRLWKEIQAECLKAMKVLGFDIACFDVMYDSSNNAKHDFWIAEANSNPELLANTFDAYVKAIDKLIKQKAEALPNVFKDLIKLAYSKDALLDAIERLNKEGTIPDLAIKALIKLLK